MHSRDVILYRRSGAKERSQHGKRGTFSLMFPPLSKKLTEQPTEVDEDDMQKLERFVVVMYDRSSEATCVNDARLDLFARKQRAYDAIPPTQAALKEHVKRATYQAGCIWSQAIISQPEVHSPSDGISVGRCGRYCGPLCHLLLPDARN